ncbi:ABC transporter ATP-binding protein [Flavihumibacter petaseus]|uniref:Putative ABC transporter permease/ATP-binding protein n=1 Tax=Flavihumibacter petaseus NBRC 106054 TaxID=1220578 RepID=A0A0E9MVF5_9BACT|nr:ABC transporter ATP-binding protein [Flavihumibacter petaseus]GAO41742.1 putative ABC transporter permease/ATP-binding protein [Flavihumibacter petaseus NBRC 106054]
MKNFSRILKYLSNKKGQIALYFACNLLSIVFSLVSLAMLAPFLQLLFGNEKPATTPPPALTFSAKSLLENMKYQFGQMILEHDKLYALSVICIVIVLAIFLKNFFLYFSYRIQSPLRNYVLTRLRSELYAKILILPIGFFTEQRKGDIISRMSNDANEIEWSVISALESLLKEPLTIIVILVSLVMLSPALSLFLLVLLPVAGFIIGRVGRSLKKQSNVAQEQQGLMLSVLDETLGGLRVIKAFNAEGLIGKRFEGINKHLNNIRNAMNFRRDLASPMSEFLGVIVVAILLWFGGRMVLKYGMLSSDTFITYIVFFTQIINPAKSFSNAFYNVQRGSAAILRIEEILAAPVLVEDKPGARELVSFNHRIEFRNVYFSYDEKTVLEDINLVIEKGKTVALVGSSGSGKSTLADLIPRFHDVTKGEILIDGVNIKDYTLHSLRKQMSIVTQEPILFNDSIYNNIAVANPEASLQDIELAAKVANAHNFITKKEEGYQTNIGDRGSKLSGGERQRLTIARAVLKNPPILILDEATSSLDTESERLVQEAIDNMMQARTSLVIAHRLSTIRHADEIIVMQQGRIVERGNHDALIENPGFYKRLVDMQEVK